jgi:hypothetical protein
MRWRLWIGSENEVILTSVESHHIDQSQLPTSYFYGLLADAIRAYITKQDVETTDWLREQGHALRRGEPPSGPITVLHTSYISLDEIVNRQLLCERSCNMFK